MSEYRLVVTRILPNPTYASELAEYEKRNQYSANFSLSAPTLTFQVQVLDVTLTEAEYVAVKRAAIEASK